jgi:hypothetical protein
VLVALLAPVAALVATAGDVRPFPGGDVVKPALNDIAPCCAEIVAATPDIADRLVVKGFADTPFAPASRYHTRSRFLPVGVAPERGLQVRTILTARSISDVFPEIRQIGGVRPDVLPWHPLGLALDVMIPDPSSADGIALGNKVVAYVLANATRFGIQDVIWRGVYYTPNGAQPSRLGHYDHVHVTTTGGGYPRGGETYLR